MASPLPIQTVLPILICSATRLIFYAWQVPGLVEAEPKEYWTASPDFSIEKNSILYGFCSLHGERSQNSNAKTLFALLIKLPTSQIIPSLFPKIPELMSQIQLDPPHCRGAGVTKYRTIQRSLHSKDTSSGQLNPHPKAAPSTHGLRISTSKHHETL